MINFKKILTVTLITVVSSTFMVGCDLKEKLNLNNKGSEEFVLGFNGEVNDSYTMNSIVDMDIKMSVQEQEISMPMKMEISQTMKIKDKKDTKEMTLEQTVDNCKMSMDALGNKVELDTDASDASSQQLRDMFIGKPITMTVKADGSITDIKYPESLLADPMMKEIANSQKQAFDNTFARLPGEDIAIEVGTKWKAERSTTSSGQSVSYTENYEISKIENGKIYIDSTITSESTNGITIGGLGNYIYSEETGMIEASTVEMTMRGKMKEPTTQSTVIMDVTVKISNDVNKN